MADHDSMSLESPLVSVIVPTFNRLHYLQGAVESVRNQRYRCWELIVVDDGSADETVAYLRSLRDPRISVVTLVHCGVVARIRNAGIRCANGEYVAFLDSDDLWMPDKLHEQVRATSDSGCRWSYTRFGMIDERGRSMPIPSGPKWHPHSGWILPALITTEATVGISTIIVQRRLLDEAGRFDEDPLINFREDYDLFLRLAGKARALAVDHQLAVVRQHAGRSSGTLANPFRTTARVYDKFLASSHDPHVRHLAKVRRRYHRLRAAKHEAKRTLARFLRLGSHS